MMNLRFHCIPLLAALVAMAATVARAQQGGEVVRPPVPNRSELQVTPLEINAPGDDFSPSVLRGGEVIYFTSARSGPFGGGDAQRIWLTRSTPTGWSTPVTASESLSRARHVGGATLTPDGNFMIFGAYRWDDGDEARGGLGRTDLYSAERVRGEWANIANLGPTVNGPFWDSQPALSADGRTLYFVSNREGGLGGTDLYISQLTESGWTPAINVGAPINSPGNELSPSVAPDGQTLFFASDGHGGVGGLDLFAAKGSGGSWTSIENMGSPINSPADEVYFVSVPNSRNSYFGSNRGGSHDLMMAYPNPYPPEAQVAVSGRVLDAASRLPIAAQIVVSDLESGEVVANFRTDDRSGSYYVLLTRGRRYSITAEAPRYVFYSNEYLVPADIEGRQVNQDILLTRAAVDGLTRLLVFFDFDKSELKKASIPELRRAATFLRQNPDLAVEIAGHTDSVGTEEYNVSLSQARADAVAAYLAEAGIARARLIAHGYGESQPVGDNATEEGKATNRRVEMRIVTLPGPGSSERRR